MRNLARKLEAEAVPLRDLVQEAGTVVRVEAGAFTVGLRDGEVAAEQAATCLLVPTEGDRVLVWGSRLEGWYILAILRRPKGAMAAVSIEGDLELRLRTGRLVMAAQEGVEIVSARDVSVASQTVSVNALDGDVVLKRLTFLGTFLRAEVDKIKLFAEHLDSVVERVTQRVKRAYRTVDETDQLRAGRIDYKAKSAMSLHAENALLTAEQLVKIDGDQIHVG